MSKTMQADAEITGHNVTDVARTKEAEGYCSSVTCTVEAGSFRIAWKKASPPPVGTVVTVEFKEKNARGIPIRARIVRLEPSASLDVADLLAKCQIGLKKDRAKLSDPAVSLFGVPKDGRIMSLSALTKDGIVINMEAGEKLYIPASSKNGGYHFVCRPKAGGRVYCSCPAWKFQKLPVAERTCKHCETVNLALGEYL